MNRVGSQRHSKKKKEKRKKKSLGVRKDADFNFGSRMWKGPVSCSQLLIILGRLTSSNTFILLILEKDLHIKKLSINLQAVYCVL
jgi:hypothetical protein